MGRPSRPCKTIVPGREGCVPQIRENVHSTEESTEAGHEADLN